jgi:hypothetical protein
LGVRNCAKHFLCLSTRQQTEIKLVVTKSLNLVLRSLATEKSCSSFFGEPNIITGVLVYVTLNFTTTVRNEVFSSDQACEDGVSTQTFRILSLSSSSEVDASIQTVGQSQKHCVLRVACSHINL